MLERRRGGKHDVRVVGSIGEKRVVNGHEEVGSSQCGTDGGLIRQRSSRIAVVVVDHFDRGGEVGVEQVLGEAKSNAEVFQLLAERSG